METLLGLVGFFIGKAVFEVVVGRIYDVHCQKYEANRIVLGFSVS